ncbi:MAG: tRNA-(ms[2]io[6]A)-hydroxylase [Gammaproteobacteria bacterium]|nr:tRNA-(ms[2]io[6]A)-hydroxylase [Gammaproteobacteria bacterium]
MAIESIPSHLQNFLQIATPKEWVQEAIDQLPLLLIDHAHCERKAAVSAIHLMSKNPHYEDLLSVLSPIAREELLHFEKVMDLLKQRNIRFQPLKPSQYGKKLHEVRSNHNNQQRLFDDLIISAIIEARSCERFFSLLPFLEDVDTGIFKFYQHLAVAEQRHFEVFIELASQLPYDLDKRIRHFIQIENLCIQQSEACFRFHSGIPFSLRRTTAPHTSRGS